MSNRINKFCISVIILVSESKFSFFLLRENDTEVNKSRLPRCIPRTQV